MGKLPNFHVHKCCWAIIRMPREPQKIPDFKRKSTSVIVCECWVYASLSPGCEHLKLGFTFPYEGVLGRWLSVAISYKMTFPSVLRNPGRCSFGFLDLLAEIHKLTVSDVPLHCRRWQAQGLSTLLLDSFHFLLWIPEVY